MYFEIENSPETIKRARKNEEVQELLQEECPRLILAPFSRPPQVVFENVLVGTTCEKELDVFNPTKCAQQITLSRFLPPGLVVNFPRECLQVEPETCYRVSMAWTPTQLTAVRETIRFTNDNRGRHDVIIILKSIVPFKKNTQQKSKTSPGKVTKRTAKKSPVALYKKKMEAVRSTVTVKKTVNIVQSTQYTVVNPVNKENTSPADYTQDPNYKKCPFESPSHIPFMSSEVFSNMLRPKAANFYDTYDESFSTLRNEKSQPVPSNVLKPSNRQPCEASLSDIFDNLTFTPLKSVPSKSEKLEKGPRIILSVNSESDFDDSVDIRSGNKENDTHSIICITSVHQPTQWLTTEEPAHVNESPVINKKIPNTSSPTDMNSPNFSINTDYSRISDLSFFPQRFSTERKMLPKVNNETREIVDDSNVNLKLNSDTYTKESPNTPLDFRVNKNGSEFRHLPSARESYSKMCRQSLFREQQNFREFSERNYPALPEHHWHNDPRADARSPPRSMTPPLQSIPEESLPFSHTQVLDKTDKHAETFTINQTFDKTNDLSSVSVNRQSTWSKRAVRAEPAQYRTSAPVTKQPTKRKSSFATDESLRNKTNRTPEKDRNINQSSYLNYVGNVYTQSSTVDPFLSSTYYYDQEAVKNFEKEFKRWLNYVLTPPADLDSNIEQKIDVGKAWIENRNKEVPLAPTKEQVCSTYHDSKRLESLRRAAGQLLHSPEISQVSDKLQAQIEKKLIAIRNDKNLHLDIGLQKMIIEIILSYNPLWLRIGLEAIYALVLPLKSNNDIEGLTAFIIQRMFKNPFLKNKNSKSSTPNVLLPAYVEAIKKFTLKKFFMLVFFLDRAKQKKLIPHDPCLFRRNAPYKESKAIIINFTKELIAGIGDITKHLRPLGYVVSHKQSNLDEYIYAVHNIAVDIRDGVRLTRVMEIILMRSDLLHQLRTPAISRLQKIHNVQVALNALNEANFTIVGDITAADIADGHREKTLSLLWQIIHVFRAPLFQKSANVIRVWWRKIYGKLHKFNFSKFKRAIIKIQASYRRNKVRTEYLRQRNIIVKLQRRVRANQAMKKDRMHFIKMRNAAIVIQNHTRAYQAMKVARAKYILQRNSAILIQRYYRAYLQKKTQRSSYRLLRQSVIKIQSRYRSLLAMRRERNAYLKLRHSVLTVQRRYRAKILMRETQNKYEELKNSAVVLQRRFRALLKMREERMKYIKLKSACITIQNAFRAYLKGKQQRTIYLKQKESTIRIQRWYRSLKRTQQVKQLYLKTKQACTTIQTMYKAYVAGKKQRQEYIKMKAATVCIQKYYRNYLLTKTIRKEFLQIRTSTIVIQQFYRSWLQTKHFRLTYLKIRQATITIQLRYRQYRLAKLTRREYCKLKLTTICIQQRYRSIVAMRKDRESYVNLKHCTLIIQRRFRALQAMRRQRQEYLRQRSAIITLQKKFKALYRMKEERSKYLRLLQACRTIQIRYRAYKQGTEQRKTYLKLKDATTNIQQRFRALLAMREERRLYLQKRSAAIVIQRRFRARQMMLKEKAKFKKVVNSCITIQQFYRKHLYGTKQRDACIRIRSATILIQKRWREYRETKITRDSYIRLRTVTIAIQRHIRAKNEARLTARKLAVDKIQTWYISIKQRDECRSRFVDIRTKVITLQTIFRAYICRRRYLARRRAAVTIQRCFRDYKLAKLEREKYITVRCSIIKLQAHVRRFIQRKRYLRLRNTVLTIQTVYRFKKLRALTQKRREEAAVCIQKNVRRYLAQSRYKRFLERLIFVQKLWRSKLITRLIRYEFLQKRSVILKLQAAIRGYLARKEFESRKENFLKLKEVQRRNSAASKIQALFRGHRVRRAAGERAAALRRRWRAGALRSNQESLRERNRDALEVLRNITDINSIIRAMKSLEMLTEVMPLFYEKNAAAVLRRVDLAMSVMNRSVCSVEVLRSGAAVLVNLARYRITGPSTYERDRIEQTLKYMLRFISSETQLFCILCTYIWLFAKYDAVKKDLTEFLHTRENRKMLETIKGNVNRMKRMVTNRNKLHTPQPSKFISRTMNLSLMGDSVNASVCSTSGAQSCNNSGLLPALQPGYGIRRKDKPLYFGDPQQAINALFQTYGL